MKTTICRQCGTHLTEGRCLECGWEAEKKKPRAVGTVKPIEYLSDEDIQAEKERIGNIRDENPETWRQILAAEAHNAAVKIAAPHSDRAKKKRAHFQQCQEDLKKNQLSTEVERLMDVMPSPHDKEGMAEYIDILKRHQRIIP